MLQICYFITILLVIFGMLVMRKEKKQLVSNRISKVLQHTGEESKGKEMEQEKLSFSKRVIAPIWNQLQRNFKKRLTKEKQDKLEYKLLQAGSPFGMTPIEFRVVQNLLLISLPVLLVLYAAMLKFSIGIIILFLLIGLGVGAYLPTMYLNQKTNARQKQASKELPDFLDLLTVSIEAGLGFDSALSKVVAKRQGVLSQEFQRCLEEMRLGKTRKEALSGVRSRLFTDDIKSLIGSILQAEQLGIGMVQILRVQSVEVRGRRKQRAEEQAMKAPVKMLFPLILFIFPCIFIVLLGPVLINLMGFFGEM
ncbi:type II secretion system F family protein [Radiobacillus sp. PE A8.2]|uniref:type II secretion system F family protein n=1 Tax=Radiobacillus sp. PE A8.2 TaxID=3380349 RepID=UPI00388E9032